MKTAEQKAMNGENMHIAKVIYEAIRAHLPYNADDPIKKWSSLEGVRKQEFTGLVEQMRTGKIEEFPVIPGNDNTSVPALAWAIFTVLSQEKA